MKDLSAEHPWFTKNYPPQDFFAYADKLKWKLTSERFFNEPGITWLREAWTLGKFGTLINAKSVRLSPQGRDPPDGYISISGIEYPIEVTEALPPDRERGKEHKEIIDGPKDIPREVLLRDEREYGDWVRTSALRKLEKETNLPLNTIVLIHLSAWLFFLEHENIWTELFKKLPKPRGNINYFCTLHSGAAYTPENFLENKIYTA